MIGLLVLGAVGAFAIWLSATTPTSTTFTRAKDLDPLHRTIMVAGAVVLVLGGGVYRFRKDNR